MKYQNPVSNYKYRDFKSETDHSFVQAPPLIKLCNIFELLYFRAIVQDQMNVGVNQDTKVQLVQNVYHIGIAFMEPVNNLLNVIVTQDGWVWIVTLQRAQMEIGVILNIIVIVKFSSQRLWATIPCLAVLFT